MLRNFIGLFPSYLTADVVLSIENFYPHVYNYCGIHGNNRSSDKAEDRSEFYPKCKVKWQIESNELRPNIKPVVVSDLKNKDYDMTFKYVDWIIL